MVLITILVQIFDRLKKILATRILTCCDVR